MSAERYKCKSAYGKKDKRNIQQGEQIRNDEDGNDPPGKPTCHPGFRAGTRWDRDDNQDLQTLVEQIWTADKKYVGRFFKERRNVEGGTKKQKEIMEKKWFWFGGKKVVGVANGEKDVW